MQSWKYKKPSERSVSEFDLWLMTNGLSRLDYPFERIIRDNNGLIVDTWRVIRREDLGESILGWSCWIIVYQSNRYKGKNTLVIEYSVDKGVKTPVRSFWREFEAS
jgi:hypothetical protein